jgi:hypothetical protein
MRAATRLPDRGEACPPVEGDVCRHDYGGQFRGALGDLTNRTDCSGRGACHDVTHGYLPCLLSSFEMNCQANFYSL